MFLVAKNQSEEGENRKSFFGFLCFIGKYKKVLTDRLNGDMVNYTSNEPHNQTSGEVI